MNKKNTKDDFIKKDDDRFSPDLIIRKKKETLETSNTGDGEVIQKSKFKLWIENFFYHYKWHSIVALFLVFVILFCAFQTCTKTTFDTYVIYAGGKNLRAFDDAAGEALYRPMCDALGRFTEDFDNDGNRNVSFLDLYIPSSEDIAKIESEGGSINTSVVQENSQNFNQYMLYGDYYICLISDSLLKQYTQNQNNNPFCMIREYLPENAKIAESKNEDGYRLASEYGVYLTSTPLANNAGFKYLPNDTVIAFRALSEFSEGKKQNREKYARAESTLRFMLADKSAY